MPKSNQRGRNRRSGLLIVGISTLVLIAAAATLFFVVGWTKIRSVFAHDQANAHVGKVAVVLSPVNIPAFTKIDPAIFIDRNTGDFRVAWVDKKVAEDSRLVRNPGPLRGRVLKDDKAAGLALSESDFYPLGTNDSFTAAIEPGYRGVSLDASKVSGMGDLKRGDHFDLIAIIDVKTNGQGSAKDKDVVMTPEAAALTESAREWKTDRRTIVQNGKIINPLPKVRSGAQSNECFVGIRDEESAALTDALAKGVKIICQARSGLPGGDMSPAYEAEKVSGVDTITVTSGDKSWKTLVPAGKNEDKSDIDAEPKR
jgi:hypothetical protein